MQDDLISRQVVLDTISELNAISFYEAQEDSKECYYEIRQAVENMPPVTPQQKIGHWVDREMYDADRWKCSEMLEHDFEPSDITWAQEVEENSRCEMFIEKGADE